MTNYPVADFLIRLKNAALSGNKSVAIDKTKLILAVAEALKKEGFLESVKDENGKVVATLAVYAKKPVLTDLKVVSKPGLRIYVDVDGLEKKKTPEVWIISTPVGIVSDKQALKKRVGGEVIAKVL